MKPRDDSQEKEKQVPFKPEEEGSQLPREALLPWDLLLLPKERLPRWLRPFAPDTWVRKVQEITPQWLVHRGIGGLLLDLDNTLLAWTSEEIPADISTWLKSVRSAGVKACIVSNTHRRTRLASLSALLGIPYVAQASKPRKKGFLEALRLLDLSPSEGAVVGDQILTDVLGGNRAGMFTILVTPLPGREFIGTYINRFLESLLVKLLRRYGYPLNFR